MRAVETAPLTEAAALGRTLGPVDLRAIGDALSAAASAYRAAHEHADLGDVVASYTPLREVTRAIVDAIDERGTVLERASPALGRIRRGLSQAQADARERVTSILNSAKYSKAIQDRIVTVRNDRFVVPIKAEFAARFPASCTTPARAVRRSSSSRSPRSTPTIASGRCKSKKSARFSASSTSFHEPSAKCRPDRGQRRDARRARPIGRQGRTGAPLRRVRAGAQRRARRCASSAGAIRCSRIAPCRSRWRSTKRRDCS